MAYYLPMVLVQGKTSLVWEPSNDSLNSGAQNILIITLSDKIARDFVKSGKPLNIDIHQLSSIQDNGSNSNVVVTTYANFGQNKSLGKKDWDLIIVDEAHTLMQSADGEVTTALDNLRFYLGIMQVSTLGQKCGFLSEILMHYQSGRTYLDEMIKDWNAFYP